MATTSPKQEALAKAHGLLLEGKVQEADDLIKKALATPDPSEPAAAETAEPAQPRKPEEVIVDLFKAVHNLLGNSPAVTPLINELEAVFANESAASAAAKA
jgi:hypothetical protein